MQHYEWCSQIKVGRGGLGEVFKCLKRNGVEREGRGEGDMGRRGGGGLGRGERGREGGGEGMGGEEKRGEKRRIEEE